MKKNRILILLIGLLIFLTLFLNNNTYAFTNEGWTIESIDQGIYDTFYNAYGDTKPTTDYDYLIVVYQGLYRCYFVPKNSAVYTMTNSNKNIIFTRTSAEYSILEQTVIDGNYYFNPSSLKSATSSIYFDNSSDYRLRIYSTCNIYTDSTCVDVFFSVVPPEAPPVEEEPPEVILPPEETPKAEIPLAQVVREMVLTPVHQTILMMIAIVVGLVVSLMGLRKVLRMLRTSLNKS